MVEESRGVPREDDELKKARKSAFFERRPAVPLHAPADGPIIIKLRAAGTLRCGQATSVQRSVEHVVRK